MANETKSSPADHYFEPTGSNANAENIGHVLNDLTDIVASGDPHEGVDTVKWNGAQFILGEGGGGIDADTNQALMGDGQGGARGASAGKASYIEDGRPRPDLGFPGFYYDGVSFGYQLALPDNVVGAPAQKLTSNPTRIMQDDPTFPGRKIEIPHHQLTLGDIANVDFSGNSLVGISGKDVRFTMHDGAKMDLTGGVKGGATGPQVYVHGDQEIYIDDTYKVVNAANKATITCVVALYYRDRRDEYISRLDSYIGTKYGAFMTEKVSPEQQPIINYEDIEAFYGQFCGYAYFNIEEESIVINKTYIPVVPEAERENWNIETYPAEKYVFITEVGMAFVYSYVFKGTYSDTCYVDDKYDTGNEEVILQRILSNSSYEQTLLGSGYVYAEYKSSSWSTTTTKKEVTASSYLGNSNFKITFPFKLIYQEKVGETVPSWTLLRSGYNKISSVFGSAKVYITENPTVTIRGASYFDLTGNPHFTMQGNSTFTTEASSQFRCKDYADIDFQNTAIMKIGSSSINIAGGAIVNIEGTDGYNSYTCADYLTHGTKASLGYKWTASHYYPEISIKNGVKIQISNSAFLKFSDISTTQVEGSSHVLIKDMSSLSLSKQSKIIMQGSSDLGSPSLFCDPQAIRLVGQLGQGDWNSTNISGDGWYTDYRKRISQNIASPTLWMENNSAIVTNGKGPSYFYMQSDSPGSPTSMWVMGGAFVQYTGNAHEEMHDGSVLIMRGSKPQIDSKTKEPIPFWTDGTDGGYVINQGQLVGDNYRHKSTSWIRGDMPQAGAPLIDLYDRSIMTLRGYWQTEGTENGSVEYRFPDDPNDEFLYDENGALRCSGNNNIDKQNILDKLQAVDASLWKKFKINTDTLEIDVDRMTATKTTVASKSYVVWKFNIKYALNISQYRTKNEGNPLVEIIENAEIRQHGNTKFILVENDTIIDGQEYTKGLTIKIGNDSAHFSIEKLKELAGN